MVEVKLYGGFHKEGGKVEQRFGLDNLCYSIVVAFIDSGDGCLCDFSGDVRDFFCRYFLYNGRSFKRQ